MYTLILDLATVVKDSDGVVVSPCQSVEDLLFVEYQTWVLSGNNPAMITKEQLLTEEYSYANAVLNYIEPPAPDSVTATQIRLALNRMGIRSDVENLITTSNDNDLIDLWEYSTTIRKDNEHVQQIAYALGINIEEVFLLASTL
jgi:hypothetical protein